MTQPLSDDLERRHLSELHELAAASGVPRFRIMRRAELIEALTSAAAPSEVDAALDAEPAAVPTGLEAPDEPGETDVDVWAVGVEEPAEAWEDEEFEFEEDREGVEREEAPDLAEAEVCSGVLDLVPDGFGFLRVSGLSRSDDDVYVSRTQVRKLDLRRGDEVVGAVHPPRRSEQYRSLARIDAVNGVSADDFDSGRPAFDMLTPIAPARRLELAAEPGDVAARMVDLVAPVGLGQRVLIAGPPGTGATRLLQELIKAVARTDVVPIVVVLDARPEEVGGWQQLGETPAHFSGAESSADAHVQIAQLALERSKRLCEQGVDAMLVVDSLTRLARAHALSRHRHRRGRVEADDAEREDGAAIINTKRFFAAGRNTEDHGSLTIVGSVRTDSGSSAEDLLHDALSDSANLELRLDRELALRGLWPALDAGRSRSHSEEAVLPDDERMGLLALRSRLAPLDPADAWQTLVQALQDSGSNRELLLSD